MPSNTTIRNITRTASLLGLVLTGLFVVFLMFLWPLFIHPPISIGAWIILLRVPLLAAHISLLIFCDPYLYIHRKALYPIRYLVMPLVIEIAKSEAIKEDTATWYVPTNDLPATDDPKELLQSFPKRVRREIKRKLKNYDRRGIRTSTEHSDHLSLYRDVPVLIDHERKSVRGTDKSFVAEFIKRFLVIFLTTSGYIDRYYGPPIDNNGTCSDDADHNVETNGKPIALSLFVGQGKVLHTLMYFCKEEENESGIWFYQHFRMILRAAAAFNANESMNNDTNAQDAEKRRTRSLTSTTRI